MQLEPKRFTTELADAGDIGALVVTDLVGSELLGNTAIRLMTTQKFRDMKDGDGCNSRED